MTRLLKKDREQVEAMESMLEGRDNSQRMEGIIMIMKGRSVVAERITTVGEARKIIEKIKIGKIKLA